MHFDAAILSTRSWALPALCALLDLHQDFDPPRHVALTRVTWAKRSCGISLEYGTQNISGTVQRSTKFSVFIHKNGIVSIRAPDAADKEAVSLGHFIAGEIERQARLWMESLHAWSDGEGEEGVDAVCSLASGIAGIPAESASIRLHRQPSQRHLVHKIVLMTRAVSYEINPSGRYGLTCYMKDSTQPHRKARLLQTDDVRLARHTPMTQKWWTRAMAAVSAFLWVVVLPLDIGSRFLERVEDEARRKPGL
jgi:hypothetical protein